ncbi:MAG: bifunctional 5,10-methylenetetrahydrofolate dehydrogenase/5,10-methenyltetrahydrofolate cyclohydrolase [Candidatus Omnitrophota bacterium]
MAKLLEGKFVAEIIKEKLKSEIANLRITPVLVSIIVGNNSSSLAYIKSQEKTAISLGIIYKLHKFPEDISEKELADFIIRLNQDKSVNGVILQRPLPLVLDYIKISSMISAGKDVEGIHPSNMGRLVFGKSGIYACTAGAVMELLKSTGIDLYGQEAVIVGSSEIVGKPIALLLLEKFATVTVCHIATSEAGRLKEHVKRAKILIVAVGRAGLIKGQWIKKGAIVIDVGINRLNDLIVGDVDFKTAEKRASFITPVPGGVGPLTVVILMRNLIEATKLQQ